MSNFANYFKWLYEAGYVENVIKGIIQHKGSLHFIAAYEQSELKDWDKAREAAMFWVNTIQKETEIYLICALEGQTPWSSYTSFDYKPF